MDANEKQKERKMNDRQKRIKESRDFLLQKKKK